MKNLFSKLSIALIAGTTLAAVAATPQAITIKATKKTSDSHKTTKQFGGFHQRQDTYKSVFYDVTATAVTPTFPTNIVVSWAVLVEGVNGRRFVGALGGTETNFGRARSVEVETDDVDLEEHEVSKRRVGGIEHKSEVYAYGIRVTDMNGTLLGSKYEPSKAEAELNDAFDSKLKRQEDPADRLKKLEEKLKEKELRRLQK